MKLRLFSKPLLKFSETLHAIEIQETGYILLSPLYFFLCLPEGLLSSPQQSRDSFHYFIPDHPQKNRPLMSVIVVQNLSSTRYFGDPCFTVKFYSDTTKLCGVEGSLQRQFTYLYSDIGS